MSSEELISLLLPDTIIKVSSTLDKSVGKKYLIDNSPETCWTSQQGLPQFVQFSLSQPVIPKRLSITFQGGFVGTRCSVNLKAVDTDEWFSLTSVYPEDVNRRQVFELPTQQVGIDGIKLIFEESSDFFGRITIYDVRCEGIFST
ncbi:galactose-binding domain-like protein [Mycena floridula]|nr:galactose-binding domain-like protein [Mycena floridula]